MNFNPDSMAAYYFEQGMESYLSGEDEQSDEVRCRYCKRRGFHWQQFDGRWRLATDTGKVHVCIAFTRKERQEAKR